MTDEVDSLVGTSSTATAVPLLQHVSLRSTGEGLLSYERFARYDFGYGEGYEFRNAKRSSRERREEVMSDG